MEESSRSSCTVDMGVERELVVENDTQTFNLLGWRDGVVNGESKTFRFG